MYDYNNGRFLSVDPFIQAPTSTQSLNPYTYIFNNPLSGIDPTGYACESEDSKECDTDDGEDKDDGAEEGRKGQGFTGNWIVINYNGIDSSGSNGSEKKNSNDIAETGGEKLKKFAENILKECSNGGCPDHVIRAAREIANGTNKYPSDSILLPASPDDFGVRVRLSPSTNLIYWEAPDGTVTTQDITQFGEQGLKAGVIDTLLILAGSLGGRSATMNEAGSIKSVNPTKGNTNCLNCSIVTDARLAGRKASALPDLKGQPIEIISFYLA